MLSGEATNTNFIVFGLTQLGFEPTSYHTYGKHKPLHHRCNWKIKMKIKKNSHFVIQHFFLLSAVRVYLKNCKTFRKSVDIIPEGLGTINKDQSIRTKVMAWKPLCL